jgi:hypothetical protein
MLLYMKYIMSTEVIWLHFHRFVIKFGGSAITRGSLPGSLRHCRTVAQVKGFCAFILILKAILAVVQLILVVTVRPSRDLPLLR